jgi:hypothetical protein
MAEMSRPKDYINVSKQPIIPNAESEQDIEMGQNTSTK